MSISRVSSTSRSGSLGGTSIQRQGPWWRLQKVQSITSSTRSKRAGRTIGVFSNYNATFGHGSTLVQGLVGTQKELFCVSPFFKWWNSGLKIRCVPHTDHPSETTYQYVPGTVLAKAVARNSVCRKREEGRKTVQKQPWIAVPLFIPYNASTHG